MYREESMARLQVLLQYRFQKLLLLVLKKLVCSFAVRIISPSYVWVYARHKISFNEDALSGM